MPFTTVTCQQLSLETAYPGYLYRIYTYVNGASCDGKWRELRWQTVWWSARIGCMELHRVNTLFPLLRVYSLTKSSTNVLTGLFVSSYSSCDQDRRTREGLYKTNFGRKGFSLRNEGIVNLPINSVNYLFCEDKKCDRKIRESGMITNCNNGRRSLDMSAALCFSNFSFIHVQNVPPKNGLRPQREYDSVFRKLSNWDCNFFSRTVCIH